MCSFRRKSRAGWYRIARKTAHTAGPHACGLARVTGLWCGSAFIPLTGRLHRSLPRLLAASWRHAFLRSPARRCPACRSQLLRCADRPVSAGGSLSAAASAVRVRSRGLPWRGAFERAAAHLVVEGEDGVRLASRSSSTAAIGLRSHVRRRCGRQVAAVPVFGSSRADSSLRAAASPVSRPGPATPGSRRRRERLQVAGSRFGAPGGDCVAAKYGAALPRGDAGP